MRLLRNLALWAFSWLLLISAHAADMKQYTIAFEVTQVSRNPEVDCARMESFTFGGTTVYYPHWGCINVGEKYVGTFSMPDTAVATDGTGKSITYLPDFKLRFGRLNLALDRPISDGYHYAVGFAGPCAPLWGCITYDVEGGEVVELRGSIYLTGDAAYLDFNSGTRGRFSGGSYGQSFQGNVTVTPVPEPAALLLVLLGVPAIIVAARVQRKPVQDLRSFA